MTLPHHQIASRWLRSLHIEGGVLDLVLTDVHDIVGIWVDPPVGTSDNSAVLMNVVLEQPIPHEMCRQEVYLKNSVDWELVRGVVMSLIWRGAIRCPCPVSSLNGALIHVLKDRVPKPTLVVRSGNKLGLMTGVAWLTV